MSESSVHSQTANQEKRGEHGEFIGNNPPVQKPSQSNESNSPGFFIQVWDKLTKISLKKLIATAGLISLIATNGLSLTILEFFFPHSSPIFHRSIAHQGSLKTSGNGQYFLVLSDNSIYTLNLKPSPTLKSLKDLNEVVVKGNLTFTPYLIDNAEIYPLNITVP